MCSRQKRSFKFKRIQHDYRNKWIETLANHVSCECKCKFDDKKWNSDQKWNNDKRRCECKKHHICKKGYI